MEKVQSAGLMINCTVNKREGRKRRESRKAGAQREREREGGRERGERDRQAETEKFIIQRCRQY